MITIDESNIRELRKGGAKIVPQPGSVAPRPVPREPEKPDPIMLLVAKLDALLSRPPAPQPQPAPPSIIVQPPEIKVIQQPAPPATEAPRQITKWKFTLVKNQAGNTTEITATAIEP